MKDSIKIGRAKKGQYGFLRYQKKVVALRTIIMFALSLSLYVGGILTTGSNKNLLTIVAILGCLPACKSTVNLVMYLKAKECSGEAYQRILASGCALPQLYDLYFTSYEKNYQVSHLVVAGKLICGYSQQPSLTPKDCESHLETQLKQGGHKGINVKIYQNLEKYCEGIKTLSGTENKEESNENAVSELLSGILALSL